MIGLRIALAIAVALTAFVYSGVPLLPKQSDSAWYWVGAQYLRTGGFVWESFYPSFSGVGSYYALGGYGLILALVEDAAGAIGADWVTLLRLLQFGAYVVTGLLVRSIGVLLRGPKTGAVAALVYFASFPFLNFAALVMSETISCLLVTGSVLLFLKGTLLERRGALVGAFLIAGYAVLLKTVLLAIFPLLWIGVVVHQWKARAFGFWALLLVAFAVIPAAQSLANHSIYGSRRIVGGFWLHLYNRVVLAGKSLPVEIDEPLEADRTQYVSVGRAKEHGSPSLRKLASDLEQRPPQYLAIDGQWLAMQLFWLGYSADEIEGVGRSVGGDLYARGGSKYLSIETASATGSPAFRKLAEEVRGRRLQKIALGTWWDLGQQLSPLGYSKEEIEEICRGLAWEALRANPGKYVVDTLAMSVRMLFARRELYPTRVYPTYEMNLRWLLGFRSEPMHRSLAEALLEGQRELVSGEPRGLRLDLYNGFSALYLRAQDLGMQALIAGSFLGWSVVLVFEVVSGRDRRRFPLLALVVVPLGVVVGSSATEVMESRYRLVVQPILIVTACAFLGDVAARAAEAWRSPRRPSERA